MPIKTKDVLEAFSEIQSTRNLPDHVVQEALAEAMEKAYRKHWGLSELKVKTVFDDKGQLTIYHERKVVDEVDDEEFEISLEDARKVKPDAQLGDYIDEEARFENFERGDILLAKNVMKQKIREAEKAEVYEKYIDKVGDLVTGIVESVEDKFVLVRLGGTPEGKPQPGSTLAMMKKSDQIPTEVYKEGQPLPVDITKVDKESKGALVMVSRSDPTFVKRLFEKEVPEIYNGIIEIKAIARDPGLRAKMAVYSHNENIDPIGACIGPKGSRVQSIIKELNGEKIDIFEWSDDLQQLVANALAPAQGVEVFYAEPVKDLLEKDREHPRRRNNQSGREERKALVAAVPDSQLSLAIGKKGQNAKLAYKLTGHRIDIRSQSDLEALGIDWKKYVDEMHNEYEDKKAADRAYKQQKRIEELKNSSEDQLDIDEIGFDYEDDFDTQSGKEIDTLADVQTQPEQTEQAEKEVDASAEEMEQAARIAKETRKSLAERRTDYVSKFEKTEPVKKAEPAKASKPKEEPKKEEKKPEKKKPAFHTMHPIYTDDELAEIEENELEEEMNASWNEDVDYEEYDSYYDDEY